MTLPEARAKAEELLREIGVEQYAMMEDRYADQRDAIARALLLASADEAEHCSSAASVSLDPFGVVCSRRAAALRQAAREIE